MIGVIRAVADFVGALLDRQTPPTERAGDLAGITSTFERNAERHESDHQLALSGGRRRLASADYLRDGGTFKPE